jgi:hypothetical protein
LYRDPLPSNIQLRTGTVKPVFFRSVTARGNDTAGVDDKARLPIYGAQSPSDDTSRHSVQSTRGTRTSTECVIEAQSASRSS